MARESIQSISPSVRGQRVVLAHGLVCGVVAPCVAAASYSLRGSESLIYPLCLALTVLLGWSMWSWHAVSRRLFDPYGLFLVVAFLFNSGHALLATFGANPLGVLDERFSVDTTVMTLTFTLLSLAAFHLGALLSLTVKSKERGAAPEPSVEDINTLGWAMFAIAAIPAAIVLYDALTVTLPSGYFALFGSDAPVGFDAAPRVLASLLVPAALFLLAGSQKSVLQRGVSAGVLGTYSLTMLIVGSRAPAMMSLVAYAWLWNRVIRRIPKAILVTGTIGVLFLLPLVRTVRGDLGADRFLAPSLRDAFLTIDSPALESVREMGGTMKTIAYTIDLVPDTRDYDRGLSYAYAMLTIVPNAFWELHPTIAHGLAGRWLTNTVDPVLARMGGGLGYSFVAESYLNFGWLGPFVLCVFGFALGRFAQWASCSASLLRAAVAATFVSSFLFFARSETGAIVRPLFWCSLMPFLACCLLARVRQRIVAKRRDIAVIARG
jgi:hypothetical protein